MGQVLPLVRRDGRRVAPPNATPTFTWKLTPSGYAHAWPDLFPDAVWPLCSNNHRPVSDQPADPTIARCRTCLLCTKP